jgi:hypothetical protein
VCAGGQPCTGKFGQRLTPRKIVPVQKENEHVWEESTRQRFQELRQRELDGTLTEGEQIELAQRIQELDDLEATCLGPAIERLRRQNLQVQTEVEALTEQRQHLEKLVQQKEQYLARARMLAEELEAERLDLLDQFSRIIGGPLREAEPAATS